ncbi:MAG TPA: sulfite exporter TauE/SafE family protein [Vicinamibacterales bacterium]|nr:sulfite exporter TauE/SafE family protein [Vicinamibacterales bacterium]
MNPINALRLALGVLTALYVGGWIRAIQSARGGAATGDAHATDGRFPDVAQLGTGAITNFFDTLGIGSFATTTAIFRLRKMVPDRIIPGTLNVGHTLPTVAQAFIYTAVIPVDVLTLFSMIAAAILGAWLGAGMVCSWPKQKVQIGMGAALLVAATLMLITQVQTITGSRILPLGGEALGVRGALLVVAVAGNFFLGALMTLGIGLYAPCMILVSLLGMNPTAAFPIMMGSCAFLMPVGSLRFIREGAYSLRNALGLAIGGVPGVLVAAFIVKSLNLNTVRWLVIVVVLYTAITMLMSASSERTAAATQTA